MTRLVLASGSPRRRALLEALGLPFDVVVPDVDEGLGSVPPAEGVCHIAARKARAVAATLEGTASVLAADTLGIHDGRPLGKPRDQPAAVAMLTRLAGRTHRVVTGIAVQSVIDGRVADERVARAETEVRFHELPAATIEAYVATGEPLDKAGAYAIQGGAAPFVAAMRGSYHNVVGLPVDLVLAALGAVGHPLPAALQVPPAVLAPALVEVPP